jgi:hypothetical protein
LAKENTRWGYEKIQGELLKLGYTLSISSVRNALQRHRVKPAPQRSTGSWRSFLRLYKNQILACDFFTVETIWFKTIYVLFFIHLGTRKIFVSGCTTNPDTTWITQQARQVVWDLKDNDQKISFLLHDNDTKFTSSFDRVFSSQGVEFVHTPYKAPRANAYAERWVRSRRVLRSSPDREREALARVLKELWRILQSFSTPQGLGHHFPISCPSRNKEGLIRRREVLGGIIHDYYRQPPAENHAYG